MFRYAISTIGCYVLSLIAAASASGLASAQTAPQRPVATKSLEEVVVTARRKEERLQDVPVAITALSNEMLQDRGISSSTELVTLTPGLQVNNRAGQTSFVIRGQGSNAIGLTSGVVQYFSEVPGFASQFFDLENVQVLKGPQGTLFGRVSTGGAVLFTPKAPTPAFEGFVNTRVGNYDNHEIQFGLGGPLIDDVLMVRMAGRSRERDGTHYNLFDDSYAGGIDEQAFRVSALLRPIDKLENLTTVQVQKTEPGPLPLFVTAINPAFPLYALPIPPQIGAEYGVACNGPNGRCPTYGEALGNELAAQKARGYRKINNAGLVGDNYRNEIFINTTTWEINDSLLLKNIASKSETRRYGDGRVSYTGSFLPINVGYLTDPTSITEGYSEELQLQGTNFGGKLNWVIGAFYEKSDNPIFSQTIASSFGSYTTTPLASSGGCLTGVSDGVFCYAPGFLRLVRNKSEAESTAYFAQGTLALTDTLNLTVGLRQTHDEQELTGFQGTGLMPLGSPIYDANADPLPSQGQLITLGAKFNKLTYSVAIDYHLNADTLIYATTRTGYKSGGFNASAPPDQRSYGPEEVTDYEVGIKNEWMAGGLQGRIDASFYYDKYDDIQQTEVRRNGANIYPLTFNAAAGRIKGFDLDTTVVFTDWFDVSAFYSVTDAKYTDTPATMILAENILPFVSKDRWGITPTLHIGGFGADYPNINLSAKIYYQSHYYDNPADSTAQVPSRTLTDLRVDWHPAINDKLTLALVVNNVEDKESLEYYSSQLSSSGQTTMTQVTPRTWYFEASYNF